MEDEKLLNIIKDYFRDNFETVKHNYKSREPIVTHQGITTRMTHSTKVSGDKSTVSYKISIDKFDFEVIKESELTFNIPILLDDYNNGRFNSLTTSSLSDRDVYKVVITRTSNSRHEGKLLSKKLEIDEDYFKSIEESIRYDDNRMMDELTELLCDLRNKKIDKLTKEE